MFSAEVAFERDACQVAGSSDLPHTVIPFSQCNTTSLEQPWVGPFAHSMATSVFSRPTFSPAFSAEVPLSEMLAKKLAQATLAHTRSFPLPNATRLYLSSHGWGPSLMAMATSCFLAKLFRPLFRLRWLLSARRCLPRSWLKRPCTHLHFLFPMQHHCT